MPTQFTTGSAHDDDGAQAGRKAFRAAAQQLTSFSKPGLCLVFGSPEYDLKNVLKGISLLLPPDAQVLGSSFEPRTAEQRSGGKILLVSLAASDEYKFQVKASAWV